MVTTAPPQQGTYTARVERQIRRRDLAAWLQHIFIGAALFLSPPLSVQTTLGEGSVLQGVLAAFFVAGGIVGVVVRIRGRYRAEKIALTFSRFGLLMYLVVLLFAAGVGYPSAAGLFFISLLFTYLDKQRLETKLLEHAARAERPHR